MTSQIMQLSIGETEIFFDENIDPKVESDVVKAINSGEFQRLFEEIHLLRVSGMPLTQVRKVVGLKEVKNA